MTMNPAAFDELPPNYDPQKISAFLNRWEASSANERANKDSFIIDLCAVLGVEAPHPKGKNNDYVFEKNVVIEHTDRKTSTCFIDVYKRGHFVVEAKQGGESGESKGTAVRGTLGWAK